MRLLHVVPTYLPAWRHGGPIRAVHGLTRSLAARGHAVEVFTTDLHGPGRLDVPLGVPVDLDGVSVRYFPVRSLRRLAYAPAMRAAFAELSRFDVVHLHSVFLWPTLAAARVAEKAGVPWMVAPRGMLVPELIAARGRWRKTLWLRLFERRTIERAAGFHATTEIEARDARRLGLRLPSVFVVPNGVEAEPWSGDLEALAPAVRDLVSSPEPFVLALGRVNWKKGLDRLIEALANVPRARLAIAGNDEEGLTPRLERLAAEGGVGERVRFLGPVDGADKAALLTRCALLAMPSTSENFGNSLLEAMAAGRPVLTTPGVGLALLVAEVGCGRVSPGDPESLGNALRELLADRPALDEMGRRGQAAAQERYGWPGLAERMEAVYREIATARSRAPR
ncbi:MAG: glycosyltransferase [Acidobacteriota bacterium]